jgi:hypothetical protein
MTASTKYEMYFDFIIIEIIESNINVSSCPWRRHMRLPFTILIIKRKYPSTAVFKFLSCDHLLDLNDLLFASIKLAYNS